MNIYSKRTGHNGVPIKAQQVAAWVSEIETGGHTYVTSGDTILLKSGDRLLEARIVAQWVTDCDRS